MASKDVVIRIKKEIRDALKDKKIYGRETYNDVIKRELKRRVIK